MPHSSSKSKSLRNCALCKSDIKNKFSCEISEDSKKPRPQAWDIYLFGSDLAAKDITVLNTAVASNTNAAAFLVKKCWQWYDGKCDKAHVICPSDIHVSWVQVGVNNCPSPGSQTQLPLGPEACCANNNCDISVFNTASQSTPFKVPLDDANEGIPLASCNSFPVAYSDTDQDGPKIQQNTPLLRVCFNTSSSCIYVKTPSTQTKFSRFTCKSGGYPSMQKCIYTLGANGGGRCANNNPNTIKQGNSVITVLKADTSGQNLGCDQNAITYCYFSGALAGANGVTATPCPSSATGSCGRPLANGIFGNCQICIKDLCPDYKHLGYCGNGTDKVFTITDSDPNNPVALSAPYTYAALTWNDPLEDCCPKTHSKKHFW